MTAIAIVLIFLAMANAGVWGNGVDSTVAHAREIEESFKLASAFVDNFVSSKGRLPTKPEFSAWLLTQPDAVYGVRELEILTSPSQIPAEIIKKFNAPKANGYILEYWRGEWFEYYVSWVKTSTLELDARKFYFLGSPFADGALLLALGLVFVAGAKLIWPSRNPQQL